MCNVRVRARARACVPCERKRRRQLDSPHWTRWFKTECQAILDRWDEEDSETDGEDEEFPEVCAFDKMTDALFEQVRSNVSTVLNAMNDKDEDLSLKVMRQRVEKALDTQFQGSSWKAWFKKEAEKVIDSWPDDDADSAEGGAGARKYVALSSMSDAELDTVEEHAERFLEAMDDAGEDVTLGSVAKVAQKVREKVEDKMNLSLADQEWKAWFKTLCQDIIEEWDADNDED